MQRTGSLWLDDALINNHHLVLSDAQFPILPPGSFQIILLSAFQTSPHWVTITLLSLWHPRHSSSILGWRMHSLSLSPCTFPALDIFQFHHLTRSCLQCQRRQFSRAVTWIPLLSFLAGVIGLPVSPRSVFISHSYVRWYGVWKKYVVHYFSVGLGIENQKILIQFGFGFIIRIKKKKNTSGRVNLPFI